MVSSHGSCWGICGDPNKQVPQMTRNVGDLETFQVGTALSFTNGPGLNSTLLGPVGRPCVVLESENKTPEAPHR